jgi:hypothetical protein
LENTPDFLRGKNVGSSGESVGNWLAQRWG